MLRKGRVVDLYRDKIVSGYVRNGVKKENQPYYENSEKYYGGNGTYFSDFSTETVIMIKIVLYETDTMPKSVICLNIRDDIKRANPSWQNLSAQRLELLRNKIVGQKITADCSANGYIRLPLDLLKVS